MIEFTKFEEYDISKTGNRFYTFVESGAISFINSLYHNIPFSILSSKSIALI